MQKDPRQRELDLDAREADLAAREAQAARDGSDPAVLSELADERDALADARDAAADARDEAALARRTAAHDRDARAAERDKARRLEHDDDDPGFSDRFLAARDVDASAGDRAEALDDERFARRNRQRSREDRQRAAADRRRANQAASTAAGGPQAEARHAEAAMDTSVIREQEAPAADVAREFEPESRAVPQARRFLRKVLQDVLGSSGAGSADALVMAANELATNAVLHARTEFTVRVLVDATGVRVEVTDGNSRVPQPCLPPLDATTGRGMAIIEGSGLDWGIDRHTGGKTVWLRTRPERWTGERLTPLAASATDPS